MNLLTLNYLILSKLKITTVLINHHPFDIADLPRNVRLISSPKPRRTDLHSWLVRQRIYRDRWNVQLLVIAAKISPVQARAKSSDTNRTLRYSLVAAQIDFALPSYASGRAPRRGFSTKAYRNSIMGICASYLHYGNDCQRIRPVQLPQRTQACESHIRLDTAHTTSTKRDNPHGTEDTFPIKLFIICIRRVKKLEYTRLNCVGVAFLTG